MCVFNRPIIYLIRNLRESISYFLLLFCLAFSIVFAGSAFSSTSILIQNIETSKCDSIDVMFNRVEGGGLSAAAETIAIVNSEKLDSMEADWIIEDFGFANYNAYKKVFMDTSLLLYGYKEGKNSDAYFYAVNETKLHDFFRIGAFELTSGRHIVREDENVCVISEDLASLNNLEVGDYIYPKLTEDMIKNDGDKNKTIIDDYPMEIIGIYKMNFEYAEPDNAYIYELPQNMIFSDHSSTKIWQDEISKSNSQHYLSNIDTYDKVTFFSDDIENIEDLEINYASSEYTSASKNDAVFHGNTSVISNVGMKVMLVSLPLIVGAIILFFIQSSKLGKSRKKEARILISSGFAKKQIFAQRFLETGIIALIAVVIAIILANLLITSISDGIKAVDASRVFEPYTYEYIRADIQFGPEITQNGYLPDDFEIKMNSSSIVWGIVIAFVVTVISALISSSFVLKKKTKDIVMNNKKEK